VTFSGYTLNGVDLMDKAAGWYILRNGTNTQGGITRSIQKVPVPGRPGYKPAPASFTEQSIIFVCRVRRDALDAFLALCDSAAVLTQTADPTKIANVELVSAIPNGDEPMDGSFDVSVTLNAYEGVWRDADIVTVGPTAITSPVQSVDNFAGLSAPIFDANIFLRGVFGQFTLRDEVSGSYLKTTRAWPGSSSTGILWVGATQQAYLAQESDPWTPVSDASHYVDQSGNGGFRMTPDFLFGDPTNRQATLTLTTLSQTSTTLRMQAKRAYRMN
jgi:hypothetical protein